MKFRMFNVILCLCISYGSIYSGNPVKEREKIFNMLQKANVNLFEVEKLINQYLQENPNEEGEGLGAVRRKFEFMRMRANKQGLYRPVDVKKEIRAYRDKNRHRMVSGNKWREMGPRTSANVTGHWAPGIGRIDVIQVNPNDKNDILVGCPTGGLWKTTDEGKNWECLNDNVEIIGVAGIGVDWNNPITIYIATGDKDVGGNNSAGVLKSTDGGKTWKETGLTFDVSKNTTIRRMVMHPTNPNILLVGYSHGIYRTTDGGNNWTEVLKSGWYAKIDDIEFKPGDPNIVYAISYDNNNSKFYRSTDGGVNFSSEVSGLTIDYRGQIAVTKANPDYVYCVSSAGIYRSSNSGQSFIRTGEYPGKNRQIYYDLSIAVSHIDPEEVHVGEVETHISKNGGQSFAKTTEWIWGNSIGYTHCDIHELVFIAGTLYVGSDGMICKSTNSGDTWTNLTEGIGNRQFRKLAVSRTNGNIIALGSQDNGTTIYTNGEWHEWLGADGSDPVIDVINEKIIYGCEQLAGNLYKSINGGYEDGNVDVTNPEAGGGCFVTPMTISSDNTIVIGIGEVYRTKDGMKTWKKLSDFGWGWNNGTGTNKRVFGIGVAFSNSDYIYASAHYTNSIRGTSNAGDSWNNIENGLHDGQITFISVHPCKPQTVAVTFSGYDDGKKIYISDNGGSTWINISGNLPNLPAICSVWDNEDGLYIGMDVGVYYKGKDMTDFVPYSNGLPYVIVNELDIHHGMGKLRAATFGRGLWEAPLYGTSNIPSNIITPIKVKPTRITIYSLQGRKIYSGKADNTNVISLVNNLPIAPGIYFLKYPISGKSYCSKMLVKKY